MSVSGIIFQWKNPRVLDALSLWPRFAPEHPGAGAPARVPGQPALPDSSAASGPLCPPGPRSPGSPVPRALRGLRSRHPRSCQRLQGGQGVAGASLTPGTGAVTHTQAGHGPSALDRVASTPRLTASVRRQRPVPQTSERGDPERAA